MMIKEVIVSTCDEHGSCHLAPMGVEQHDDLMVIKPFKPSTTLDNITDSSVAVINCTDDVRVFAGCVTGRNDWNVCVAEKIHIKRLADVLSHSELKLVKKHDDTKRPTLYFEVIHQTIHRPFTGFNRAQAAVIEASILVSRLHLLPQSKIQQELDYLQIAIDKTAGVKEQLAWSWLLEKAHHFLQQNQA